MGMLDVLGISTGGVAGAGTQIAFYLAFGIFAIVFLVFMAGLAFLIAKFKSFSKFKCHIFRRRKVAEGKENLFFVGYDKAGIIKDKKHKRYYFKLSKNKTRLNPETNVHGEFDIPSIPNLKGGEIVFLEEVGTKRYVFLDPVDITGGRIQLKITHEDTAEAIREYEENMKLLANPNKWVTIGIILIAVTGFIIALMWTMQGKQLAEIAKLFKEMLPTLNELVRLRGAQAIATGTP